MRIEKVKAGEVIAKRQDKVMEWFLIQEGTVIQKFEAAEMELNKNSMIGILENDRFICDYVAKEESVLIVIECKNARDLQNILAEHSNFRAVFLRAALEQRHKTLCLYAELLKKSNLLHDRAQKYYEDYIALCEEMLMQAEPFSRMDSLEPIEMLHKAESWEISNSNSLMKKYLKEYLGLMIQDNGMCVGAIMEASAQMRRVTQGITEMVTYLKYNKDIMLAESQNDILHLYFDLAVEASKQKRDISKIQEKLLEIGKFIIGLRLHDEESLKECQKMCSNYDFSTVSTGRINVTTEDCVGHILNYVECKPEEITEFKALIKSYRNLPDMYSTEPEVMRIRKLITKRFYEIYEKAFLKVAKEETKPSPIMLMFFNFGFMDVELAGEENANALYNLTDQLGLFNSENVYTVYEWLMRIYKGEKEPSRNEFDQDYNAYLIDLRRKNEITEEEAKEYKQDQVRKVQYEIQNMFQSANRMTYGKITTFCPIVNGEDLINAVEKMAVTADKIETAINKVREIDYSILFRKVTFSDVEHDFPQEIIMKEVMPDVILMPIVGIRGAMWQETASARYDSKARFVFPMFMSTDLDEQMLENMGRYRWEICRRIQGVYWNDIRDKSLTSEYCDYLQFYRKNSSLSAEVREKVKIALKKSRNNFREVFVKDYINWMKYEARGSFRLNKVARGILTEYCPFSAEIRQSLKANPLFESAFNKLELTNYKKLQRLTALYGKYEAAGGELTADLKDNLKFYQM